MSRTSTTLMRGTLYSPLCPRGCHLVVYILCLEPKVHMGHLKETLKLGERDFCRRAQRTDIVLGGVLSFCTESGAISFGSSGTWAVGCRWTGSTDYVFENNQ